MKTKHLLFLYLFVLLILSQTELATAVIFLSFPFFIILVFRNLKIKLYTFSKLIPLIILVFIGFMSGLFHLVEYSSYFYFRDIMYFIQAPMFILLGSLLYNDTKDIRSILKLIVLASFIITVSKFVELALNPSLIFQLGLQTRYEYSLSNDMALLGFIILYYSRKYKYRLFNYYFEIVIMFISFISIVVSFSRTSYILFLLLLIIPYISKFRIPILMYISTIVMVIYIIFGGLFIDVQTAVPDTFSFEAKLEHSLDEMVVQNYDTIKQVNDNWRGYEAYIGLSKYYEGNSFEILFGQGFGTVAILPYWVFHGAKLNILPMFHNGYITIILKTGLFGFFLFLSFMFILLQMGYKGVISSRIKELKLASLLLVGIVFILEFYTLVIHGIFRTTVPVLILILLGSILQLILVKSKNNKKIGGSKGSWIREKLQLLY